MKPKPNIGRIAGTSTATMVTLVLSVSCAPLTVGDEQAKKLTPQLQGVEEIVFACRQPGKDGHWYANFGYFAQDQKRKAYAAGGRLCKLNVKTGKVTVLLDDPKGSLRDPQVHYDGKKIIFSYRKGGTETFHLYEIGADPSTSLRSTSLTAGTAGGKGLRQITDGRYDDIEPTYLPDGGIMFCSSRCKRWVDRWVTQVATIYRCDADGKNIRQLSSNLRHDNAPWVLPDGRILYQRWEYIDHSQVNYHHLWTMNPDGTGQMVYYDNLHPPAVMIDAKGIPGTDKIVAVIPPPHGKREHEGAITIVSPKHRTDKKASAQAISQKPFRDPYPLSEDSFLVASGTQLLVMDGRGNTREIYRLGPDLARTGVQCYEPRPLRRRPRERVIPSRVDLKKTTGRLILADIYKGRNMAGVKRGRIKKLLVLEALPKPINFTGGMEPISLGGTFTLKRILGTVPIEPDGSANMELPANRSLFFVALDKRDSSVKRMQSFLTVMPGETTSCAGDHERRTVTPTRPANLAPTKRPPSKVTPLKGIPEVIDFPRDIQPILNRHCIYCHGYELTRRAGPRANGVILTGDRGPMFSHSYFMLTARYQIMDGHNRPVSNDSPRRIGDSASPMIKKIQTGHNDVRLSADELLMVRMWINSGAAYPGTYGALGTGMIGGLVQNRYDMSAAGWPSTKAAARVIQKRCVPCHPTIARHPADDLGVEPRQIRRVPKDDPKFLFSRHILYNLTRPPKSMMLLAPLSRKDGGYQLCEPRDKDKAPAGVPQAVFAGVDDPDYRTLLRSIRDTKKELDRIKRFDMKGFRPHPGYIREMKRFGILPRSLKPTDPVDPYKIDWLYWKSLWYQPPGKARRP